MPTRNATATWAGGLTGGKGSFKGESGAIGASYSFGSRFESGTGSNPEELLAAAEAACFSMALAGALEAAGTPATKVETRAACTVEKQGAGFTITTMKLKTRATVPGVDKAAFQKMVQATKEGCPVSKALKAIQIDVDAELV